MKKPTPIVTYAYKGGDGSTHFTLQVGKRKVKAMRSKEGTVSVMFIQRLSGIRKGTKIWNKIEKVVVEKLR